MTKQDKIREILDIIRAGDDVKNTLVAMMHELVKDHEILTPEDVPDSLLTELADAIEVDKLLCLYAPIYDALLTEDEIDKFLGHVKTPLAVKLRSVMPDIVLRCSIIGRAWMENKAEDIERVVERFIAKLEGVAP